MDWSDRAVSEFGRQIGMPDLALNENKQLQLIFEDEKVVGIISLPTIPIPEFVVYISQPLGYISPLQLKNLLQASNYKRSLDWPMQVGRSNKKLFVALRIPQRAISVSSLNHAISILKHTLLEIS